MSMTPERFPSTAGPIPVDVYSPVSSNKLPAVLILHGTLGLKAPFGTDIVSFATALNDQGIAAAIPHYFESTHTHAGDEAMQGIFTHLPAWKAACEAAWDFVAADARFDGARLGVLGFSLGGHLALRLAMTPPAGRKFKAVVDFFGPTLTPEVQGDWSALPATLIHHGTADPLPIANSMHAVNELRAAGRTVTELTFGLAAGPAADYQFVKYPGEGHGFKGAALSGSRESTVSFLKGHLI